MMTEEQQKLVAFLEEKIGSLRFAVKQNAFEKIRPELKHELDCAEIALAALTQPASPALKLPDGLNETTAKLVISFATALAEKLHLSEVKYGWSDAWKNPGWQDKCLADFNHHIGKGDPRDVAAYCAFMWFHGWTTSRLNAPHTAPIEPICATGGAEWVKVPRKLTADNGAKSALIGEFKEDYSVSCPECFGEEECETCDGSGRIHIEVPVSWTTIKAIWDMGVEHFTTAPEVE